MTSFAEARALSSGLAKSFRGVLALVDAVEEVDNLDNIKRELKASIEKLSVDKDLANKATEAVKQNTKVARVALEEVQSKVSEAEAFLKNVDVVLLAKEKDAKERLAKGTNEAQVERQRISRKQVQDKDRALKELEGIQGAIVKEKKALDTLKKQLKEFKENISV